MWMMPLYKVKNFESYGQVDIVTQLNPHTCSWSSTTDVSQPGTKQGGTTPRSARPVIHFVYPHVHYQLEIKFLVILN